MTSALGRLPIVFLAFLVAAVFTGMSGAQPSNAQPSGAQPSNAQPSGAQPGGATWLDAAQPVSWNQPGPSIPAAPRIAESVDPRCRDLARPPELEEDRLLREQGWDLVGPYQGGWQIRVILATAGYDGMCRPRQYQGFVFVHGVLAGTLSPKLMDSRTDGALDRVTLQGHARLIAEYRRYTPQDPLCCPSRTTSVVFDFAPGTAALRPVSASTSANR